MLQKRRAEEILSNIILKEIAKPGLDFHNKANQYYSKFIDEEASVVIQIIIFEEQEKIKAEREAIRKQQEQYVRENKIT